MKSNAGMTNFSAGLELAQSGIRKTGTRRNLSFKSQKAVSPYFYVSFSFPKFKSDLN